jgi:hypothetical protein
MITPRNRSDRRPRGGSHARNQVVPSDLYRFAEASDAPVTLKVNGRSVPVELEKGYAKLDREWKAGDVVELGLPMPASTAKVTASPAGRNTRAVNDQSEPRSSRDSSDSFFHWWPEKGSTEWIEYELAAPATVSAVEVYWFDDTPSGECRLPASWRVLYKDGGEWKPGEAAGAYETGKDRYSRVAFKPVSTSALRLEVTLQPQWSAGILEWKIE